MTPALLFSKVAFSLTPSKLKEMWIIPLGQVRNPAAPRFVPLTAEHAVNSEFESLQLLHRHDRLGRGSVRLGYGV